MAKQQLQKWELKFVTELEPLEGASPVFTTIYDQMSEKPTLLAVTLLFASYTPDPRTVANIRYPDCG